MGGRPVLLVWFERYQSAAAFLREQDGRILQIGEVGFPGNSDAGGLERTELVSEIYWMVWSHFYPDTRLLDQAGSLAGDLSRDQPR